MNRSEATSAQLATESARPSGSALRELLGRVGRLFARSGVGETVATTMLLDASPGAVWQGILFYEEVPSKPLLLLRIFLPRPVRTDGDKTRVGSVIRCTYDGGHLIKRITGAEPARFVRFEVLEQRLGIESCVSMGEGSYEIRGHGRGSEVVLTTHYRGHLRPRWLWRPLERHLAHEVHRHILDGMRQAVATSSRTAALKAEPTAALAHTSGTAE